LKSGNKKNYENDYAVNLALSYIKLSHMN